MACQGKNQSPIPLGELPAVPPAHLQSTPVSHALLTITEKAARKALDMLAKRGGASALRVKVLAGGCSGYSYDLQPVAAPDPGDRTVTAHGLTVHLEGKSLLYLVGTVLDYESTLMSQKFTFKNPNAVESCSCGESFGV
jgi:iron-sulfur cluster assembly protein